MMQSINGQPVIIGAGLAGLMTALKLAPEPVLVLSAQPLGSDAASGWAQGGVAAAVGPDDNPMLHLRDTLAAGDGLCDPEVAERVVKAGPDVIDALVESGVEFDHDADGSWSLGLEAAHSRRRILHADGDSTGAAIMKALVHAACQAPSITVIEGAIARRLLVDDNRIYGVLADNNGRPLLLPTSRVVLATGGLGSLYKFTTNPPSAIGLGQAMAARAGAAMADMEFEQFHPTALRPRDESDWQWGPLQLISEAVRGEGAILINENGDRFMAGQGRAELEPRDVVARAVWHQIEQGRRVFLDARVCLGSRFPSRFPGIYAACRKAGTDPVLEPIPVVPAAHFHVGGVAVDEKGRTTVQGLWACGEVASSGFHGANRLASNSLLEAAASATWVAQDVSAFEAGAMIPVEVPPLPAPPSAIKVRPILDRYAGVIRDEEGLRRALALLSNLIEEDEPSADPAITASLIVEAALRRKESRGGHFRSDFPAHDAEEASRQAIYLGEPIGVLRD